MCAAPLKRIRPCARNGGSARHQRIDALGAVNLGTIGAAATEATLASLAATIADSNSVYVPGSAGQIILARRRDADTSPAADGDLTVFNIDEEGRLKVASKPAT